LVFLGLFEGRFAFLDCSSNELCPKYTTIPMEPMRKQFQKTYNLSIFQQNIHYWVDDQFISYLSGIFRNINRDQKHNYQKFIRPGSIDIRLVFHFLGCSGFSDCFQADVSYSLRKIFVYSVPSIHRYYKTSPPRKSHPTRLHRRPKPCHYSFNK
jgi:hypothetical protein